jgi:hypothetical protein
MERIFIIILIYLAAGSLLSSCVTFSVHGVLKTPTPPPADIVIHTELRDFLSKKPNPTVMLRVPTSISTLTGDNTKDVKHYSNFYGAIEKELMREGFTVRDRGLINTVIGLEQASYKEIGEKTKTDIFIEITSFTVKNANIATKEWFKISKKEGVRASKGTSDIANLETAGRLRPEEYVIECKIIVVEEGLTGGIFELHYCACNTSPCSFTFYYDKSFSYSSILYGVGNCSISGSSLIFYIDTETVAKSFGKELVAILRNKR